MTFTLSDIRVLDLTQLQGSHCGKLLADMGAEVIKVEPPGGSAERRRGPYQDGVPHPERSLHFAYYNTNKLSITLDLDEPEGASLFQRLAQQADVVVTSHPPGYLEQRRLTYADLAGENPRLIMASVTPCGDTGPHAHFRGPDIVPFALSGLMYLSGEPDQPPQMAPGQQASDLGSAHAAIGILAALYGRSFTGVGQCVEVSMQEALAMEEHGISRYDFDEHIIQREGSQHGAAAPGRIFPCADGYIHLFVGGGANQGKWGLLLDWMDHPEMLSDPVWSDPAFRRGNVDIINPLVGEFLAGQSREELVSEGQRRRLPTAPVHRPEEFARDAHMEAREFFVDVKHPDMGCVRTPRSPLRLESTPWTDASGPRPAPRLGEHNERIYQGLLGLERDDLIALRLAGVI